jgi:CubicO group peptidase (beta-lactamase class C family)
MTMRCGLPYCHFDGPTDDITIKGMQDCMRPLWERGHYTLREQLDAVSKAPLKCNPGEEWIYGFSSEIAAGLVEVLCDKPINDALHDLIYEPLGMNNTGAVYFGDAKDRLVTLYSKAADGKLGPGPDFFDKKHNPGSENEAGWGRLFSNGEDYSKLMQMLACGGEYNGVRLMGRKTIDLMRSNTLGPDGFGDTYNGGYGYGYGVRTLIDPAKGNNNGSIGAFGWTGAFGTWCEADPSEGISIVYMHNLMPDDEEYCHPRVRAVAYGLA